MKIESGRGVGATQPSKKAAGAAAPGFAPEASAASAPATAGGIASIGGIDGILALQAEGFAPGRRARQARRGEDALDTLAQLAAGLLAGRADRGLLSSLAANQAASEPTGEPGLDAILQEIDIRVAVELAKLESVP